jgi:hypothetical protein
MVSITYSGVDQLYVKVGNFMSLDTMTDIQTSQSNNFILEDQVFDSLENNIIIKVLYLSSSILVIFESISFY